MLCLVRVYLKFAFVYPGLNTEIRCWKEIKISWSWRMWLGAWRWWSPEKLRWNYDGQRVATNNGRERLSVWDKVDGSKNRAQRNTILKLKWSVTHNRNICQFGQKKEQSQDKAMPGRLKKSVETVSDKKRDYELCQKQQTDPDGWGEKLCFGLDLLEGPWQSSECCLCAVNSTILLNRLKTAEQAAAKGWVRRLTQSNFFQWASRRSDVLKQVCNSLGSWDLIFLFLGGFHRCGLEKRWQIRSLSGGSHWFCQRVMEKITFTACE